LLLSTSQILLITAGNVTVGKLSIKVIFQNESACKLFVTATPKQIGNQLYALLSIKSTCGNDNNIVIGVVVGVTGFLLLIILLFVVIFYGFFRKHLIKRSFSSTEMVIH